jgi:hypothetical protein
MPDSLEQLDLLLLAVAGTRKIHPDGIRFQGLHYVDLTLVAYVGETVTLQAIGLIDDDELCGIKKTVDELLELKNGSGKTGITENLIPAPKQERPLKRYRNE